MKTLPLCVLYTQDRALQKRLRGYLRSLADLRVVEEPGALERTLSRFGPALLLLDVRAEEGLDLLGQIPDTWPETVTVALGTPRSAPLRRAQSLGVFAAEGLEADRQRVQEQVQQGLAHLRLTQENRALRGDSPAPTHRAPLTGGAAGSSKVPLSDLSRALRKFEDVGALLNAVVDGIASSMMVTRVGIFCKTREQNAYRLRAGLRCLEETEQIAYTDRDPLVRWLEIHAHLVSRGNLDHIPDTAERLMLRKTLDALGAEILLPMHARGRMLGWLFVGHRATGVPFDYAELEDLLIVAEHGSAALENALLYEEVTIQKTLAETVLQSMPTGIVAIAPDGRVRWFNQAAESILDRMADEVLGRMVEEVNSPLTDVLRRTVEQELAPEPRSWTDPRTKRSLLVEARRLMAGSTCLGAVALIQDRSTEEMLREKEEQLERAAFWTELAASMSHEVRNPLVAIKTFAQLLPERYEDPEFRSEFSTLVSCEVDRLNKIIEQINDFAHPPQLQFQPVDINDIVAKGIDLAKLRQPPNGVRIELKAQPKLPKITGDEHALTECVAHLITNALEASVGCKKPRVDITAQATPVINGSESGISITVKDNAGGIPTDIREKIFSPFCTSKARGMGLGLPIVRRTVVDHNGRIDIDSDKGGTAVTVLLPIANGSTDDEAHSDH